MAIVNQLILGKAQLLINPFAVPTPSTRVYKVDTRDDTFTVVTDNRIYQTWRR